VDNQLYCFINPFQRLFAGVSPRICAFEGRTVCRECRPAVFELIFLDNHFEHVAFQGLIAPELRIAPSACRSKGCQSRFTMDSQVAACFSRRFRVKTVCLFGRSNTPLFMTTWAQVYYPWGQRLWPLSTLAAALPV